MMKTILRALVGGLAVAAICILAGCHRHELRVEPRQATLPLDRSVTFTTAGVAKTGLTPVGPVVWKACNLTRHQSARISSDGTFTAQLPGNYKIIADSGKYKGHATIQVPRGVTRDSNEQPWKVTPVSSRGVFGSTPPPLPQPPVTGPGWRDDNLRTAFQIQNRKGRDPLRRRSNKHTVNVDDGTGNGNYLLSIPLINVPGRGLNVSLNLFYNSALWSPGTPEAGEIYFRNYGFPSGGWSLGFGKVVQTGSYVGTVEDPDGTLHQFAGPIGTYGEYTQASIHTTDGTLIDGVFFYDTINYPYGGLTGGWIKYPNGTIVTYGAAGAYEMFPTQLLDANGNFIRITYVNNTGPQIQTIQDTLGRIITFYYDQNNLLTAITAPGLNGTTRVVARLHYSPLNLNYAFKGLQAVVGGCTSWTGIKCQQAGYAIDAIYFPGTSTGYWFGDSDSYSSYGMISKVSQRRGMTFQSESLNEQGDVTPGVISNEKVYNYPLVPDNTLAGAPVYTSMTESWAGMDTPPAVTTYTVRMDVTPPNPTEVDTVYPDGTRITQLMFNDPNQYDDGLLFQQTISDASGSVLRTVTTTWEKGDYDSPRVKSVETKDQLGQTTTTEYGYNSPRNPNQVTSIDIVDYDGRTPETVLTGYVTDSNYTDPGNRHIFVLPSLVQVFDSHGNVSSRTSYFYDQSPLSETPGVIGHADSYDPGAAPVQEPAETVQQCTMTCNNKGMCGKPQCTDVTIPVKTIPIYAPSTQYRGNVTEIVRYDIGSQAKPVNQSGAPASAQIEETLTYDITGNLLSLAGSCCVQTNFTYTPNTQYAYPEKVSRGSTDPNSSARLTQEFTYDFGTGLMMTSADANNLTTQIQYDSTTLRPLQSSLPTSSTRYQYDDLAMAVNETVLDATDSVAAQGVTRFNGVGLVQQIDLAGPNGWNAVSTQYDVLKRLSRVSLPYQLPQQPTSWTTYTYDSLGRVTGMYKPSGTGYALNCYDEARARPSSALSSTGQTVRAVFNIPGSLSFTCQTQPGSVPGLRERWWRMDALGELAEVVEPSAVGNGSVFDSGNVDSAYYYNGLGLLAKVVQGPNQQERDFQYDFLGRLTSEYLSEKSRTLDDNGKYVTTGRKWSDVFTYDTRSNLTSHTDARGVKTVYDFGNDPLNRLQRLYYETPGAVDTSSPILQSLAASYTYVATGDVTRVSSVALQNGGNPSWQFQYQYDPLARLASKTSFYPGQLPLVLTYNYDTLNRLIRRVYPSQYGIPNEPQKTVDYSYGVGGVLSNVKINGIDYASQFSYGPGGQITSVNIGPAGTLQTTETYYYDPLTGLLRNQVVQRGGSSLLNLWYNYWPTGEVSTLNEGAATTIYSYDALGRLHEVDASCPTCNPSWSWSETYAFDSYGNRVSVTASGTAPDGSAIPLDGLAGTPTPANGLSALNYDIQNHVAQSTCQKNSKPCFLYDAAGNQIQVMRPDGALVTYQYEQSGRLAQMTDASNNVLEKYSYAPDGRRLQKNSAGLTRAYVWDGSQVVAEYAGTQGGTKWLWSKSHMYLGTTVFATFTAANSGERVYYQHPDRLGIRLVTNNFNNEQVEQVTLPFGTLIPNGSGDPLNPIFTGYDRSSMTNLDYAINREYDHLQRFIQVDPADISAQDPLVPQSLNLYSYVLNDPVNLVDLLGLDFTNQQCDPPDSSGNRTCTGTDSAGNVYMYTVDSNGQIVGTPQIIGPPLTVVGTPPSPPPLLSAPGFDSAENIPTEGTVPGGTQAGRGAGAAAQSSSNPQADSKRLAQIAHKLAQCAPLQEAFTQAQRAVTYANINYQGSVSSYWGAFFSLQAANENTLMSAFSAGSSRTSSLGSAMMQVFLGSKVAADTRLGAQYWLQGQIQQTIVAEQQYLDAKANLSKVQAQLKSCYSIAQQN